MLAALAASLAISAAIAHADSSPFRFRFSASPWDGVFFSLGAGDVDRDGVPDVIVPDGNYAQVISGATGHALFTLSPPADAFGLDPFGLSFSSYAVGDLEGDGHNEIIIGAPSACSSGRVYVFSGSTGQLQFSLRSPSSPDACNALGGGAFGESVALIRAQGGGSAVVVGSPAEVGGGSVYVYSGSTHSLQRTLTAPGPADDAAFGFNLRAADGERGPVLAIASFGGTASDPLRARGRVYVFSTEGTPDFVIENPDPDRFHHFGAEGLALTIDRRGNPLVAAGEFASSNDNQYQGQAFVFSGARLLYKLTTPNPEPTNLFGLSLAFADPNGFGPSLLVGSPFETVNGNALSGRVYVFNARGKLTESLTSPHPQANDAFGVPVIVSEDSCVTALTVGAPSGDFSHGSVDYFALHKDARGGERCRSRGS